MFCHCRLPLTLDFRHARDKKPAGTRRWSFWRLLTLSFEFTETVRAYETGKGPGRCTRGCWRSSPGFQVTSTIVLRPERSVRCLVYRPIPRPSSFDLRGSGPCSIVAVQNQYRHFPRTISEGTFHIQRQPAGGHVWSRRGHRSVSRREPLAPNNRVLQHNTLRCGSSEPSTPRTGSPMRSVWRALGQDCSR